MVAADAAHQASVTQYQRQCRRGLLDACQRLSRAEAGEVIRRDERVLSEHGSGLRRELLGERHEVEVVGDLEEAVERRFIQ